jgi:PAS domain S-box-containing protein
MGAGLIIALVGIMMAASWWWLVGRRERAVSDQLRRLYTVVNQQKQIMDGVNSALSSGIVLNDLNGVIYYANQSFARMAGKDINALRGHPHTDLGPDLARSLVTHTLAVHQSGHLSSFTETLMVEGYQRYFFTSCTPFRDEAGRMTGVVSVYSDVTDLAMAQQKAQRMVNQTVNAFVRAIETVDSYLRGHSALTAQLAVTLAYCLGKTDPVTLATLRTAANLSQIGMIQLPKELFTKSGMLTPEERALLQNHVEYAKHALEGIDFGLPVMEAIVQMYERMNGSGYPEGLSGDAICENARILAVANTFCALVRSRSYRQAHSVEQALEILEEQPPKYDMQVVEALRQFLPTEQGRAFLDLLENDRDSESDMSG